MADLAEGRAAGKRVAIVQSNYIPWKGYFDLINSVDECILYDDAQYTRSDWRNRNRIKTHGGVKWMTVPVAVSGRRTQSIRDAQVSDPRWAERHWRTLMGSYARAPHFDEFAPAVAGVYACGFTHLASVNHRFIDLICSILGIRTAITTSADYTLAGGRTERLVGMCRQAGATEYVSGPSAKGYLDETLFADAGIAVRYMNYDGYAEYPQLHGPFEHAVSVLDLIFSVGARAPRYMKSFDQTAKSVTAAITAS